MLIIQIPIKSLLNIIKSHCINVGGCRCSTHDHHSNCLQLDSKPQHFQMWDLCKSQWIVVDGACHGWTWEVMSCCTPEVVGFQWSNQVSWRLRNWDGPFFSRVNLHLYRIGSGKWPSTSLRRVSPPQRIPWLCRRLTLPSDVALDVSKHVQRLGGAPQFVAI